MNKNNCPPRCYDNSLLERPPENRKPKKSEISEAIPFLERQIQLVKPEIVVCLGSTAVQAVVDPKVKITEIRGTWLEKKSLKIMPTFHPSAVFREEKRQLLKRDIIQAGEVLKHIISHKI